MKMVERMARAILSKVPEGYGMREDEAREYALAALKAIREPNDAMVLAAHRMRVVHADRYDPKPWIVAAIDAAIKEAEAE